MNARVGVSIAAAVASSWLLPGLANAQSGFVRTGGTPMTQPRPQPAPEPQAGVSAGVEVQTNTGGVVAAPPGAAADVAWEERTIRYTGGPIPPGAQLEERVNGPMVGGGAAAMALGYGLAFYGISVRPIAAVPIAGPILAIADVAAPNEPGTPFVQRTTGGQIAIWIVSEVLQLGGIALFTAGMFMPKRSLVYDAPVNAPPAPGTMPAAPMRRGFYGMRRDRSPRWMVVPAAPDAVAGASLVVTTF